MSRGFIHATVLYIEVSFLLKKLFQIFINALCIYTDKKNALFENAIQHDNPKNVNIFEESANDMSMIHP